MENVTIVTVYNACNYGSFLQAMGLKMAIEKKGYNVNFLKMNVDTDKIIGVGVFSEKFVEFETKKYKSIQEEMRAFSEVTNEELNSKCCVLGSDTIWNMFDPAYADVPYFVGKEINCKNIISYAASVGQNNYYKILLTKLPQLWHIRKLKSFGVRDDKTERFVRFIGRKPVRVLDPTFLVDFDVTKPKNFEVDNYLLVYTYGMSEEEIESIKTYAKDNELKVVATGSLCEWADINLNVGSFEWLWLVQNAACVVTNTFHGSVFSIKYNKNFITFGKESDKVKSLLSEFGLEDRNSDHNSLNSVLNVNVDFDRVNKIIDAKVKVSLNYLYKGIEC